MKTTKNLLFVAFAATSIIACQKEMAVENNDYAPAGEVVTFSGSVDNAETKTAIHYEDGVTSFETLFTSSDVIAVNGVKSKIEVLNEETGEPELKDGVTVSEDQKSITFDAEGVTAPYYAVTGVHCKENFYNAETKTYTLQYSGTGSPQKYRRTGAEGQYTSYWSNSDILAAYGESENLKFQHMSTFYAITIDSEKSAVKENIANIYVRQGNGAEIAGNWTLSFEGENHTPTLTPAKLTAFVAFNCGEEGLAQGETMIVGLPAYNYESGLIFTIKDVKGNFVSLKVPATKTQHAADGGKIIPFKPAFNPASGTINTVEDWEEFAASINAGNDWAVYRWVGNGTVKLGANIEAENLTSITKKFPYVFDGCGNTITRTKATKSLFYEVTGELKNLTLAGNLALSDYGAPFVKQLHPGAKMTDCTNNMNITFEFSDETTYVAAFAAVLPTLKTEDDYVTALTNCVNNGSITGSTSYSQEAADAPYNVAIGGVVGDVRAGGVDAVPYKVVMVNCDNNGAIKFTPKPSDAAATSGANLKAAMGLTGIGGVAGTFRSSESIELDDCDNAGNITLSAEGMTNKNGMRPYSICMGGVIGCGALQSGMGLTLTGHDITLKNCDNSGTLYNCGDNYTATKRGLNKIYTGGLAGALMGLESKYASLQSCSNTGAVLTYDLCSDDDPVPAVVSIRTCYNAVVGGLIGFGGYLDMDKCTVNCQIGNGKRPMLAWGGVIGYTVKPFILNDATLHLSGYFQRISTYKMNRAVVAVVPAATTDDSLTPTVAESKITGTLVASSTMKSSSSTVGTSVYTNLSSSLTTTMFGKESTIKSNLVCGQAFVDGDGNHTANTGVDITGVTITYSAE